LSCVARAEREDNAVNEVGELGGKAPQNREFGENLRAEDKGANPFAVYRLARWIESGVVE